MENNTKNNKVEFYPKTVLIALLVILIPLALQRLIKYIGLLNFTRYATFVFLAGTIIAVALYNVWGSKDKMIVSKIRKCRSFARVSFVTAIVFALLNVLVQILIK